MDGRGETTEGEKHAATSERVREENHAPEQEGAPGHGLDAPSPRRNSAQTTQEAVPTTRAAPPATTPSSLAALREELSLRVADAQRRYRRMTPEEKLGWLKAGAGAGIGLAAMAVTTHKAVGKTASAAHAHPIATAAAVLGGASAALGMRKRLRAYQEQMQEDWAAAPFQTPLHQHWPAELMGDGGLGALVTAQERDRAVPDLSGSAWIAPLSKCTSKQLSRAAVAYLMEAPCAPRTLTTNEVFDLVAQSL